MASTVRIHLAILLLAWSYSATAHNSVEQLHLSLTLDPSQMTASWVTPSPAESLCQYGMHSKQYTSHVNGTSWTYTDGGFNGTLHTALMTGMLPATVYFYVCGDGKVFSAEFSFKTRDTSPNTQVIVDLVGDMGVDFSANTVKSLTQDAESGALDFILHYGDISYADDRHPDDSNSHINDYFMNMIQPIAARSPYMVCPGNHDTQFSYAALLNRFIMPFEKAAPESLYYSFQYGPLHITTINTEYDFSIGSPQNDWIENDLKQAQLAKQAGKVHWIVVMGHRPLYCSSLISWERCHVEGPEYRKNIEDFLLKYQVDVYLSGHNHNYERSYPMYNDIPTNTTSTSQYYNPTAPVYIVCGSAGNTELIDPSFQFPPPDWRAAARVEFGYGRMTVTQSSFYWEYVDVDFGADVTDAFEIVRA